MKRSILLCLAAILFLSASAAYAHGELGSADADPSTTIFVVRHAEKQKDREDPGLTSEGIDRAERLRDLVAQAGVTALYSSQYKRTQATVAPLAEATGLEITVIDARDHEALAANVLENHAGGVVVVAGHSNTVPAIVAALGAPEPEPIPETDYDNLFIVTVSPTGSASVVRLQF